VGETVSISFATLAIPHTDWVTKGGSGFNYNAGPQSNFTINGTGPKGTYGDSDIATSTSQGVLSGVGSDAGPGKVILWPYVDNSSITYDRINILAELTGGDGGGKGTLGLTFSVYFEGSWI